MASFTPLSTPEPQVQQVQSKGSQKECCRDNFRSSRKHRPDKRTRTGAMTATFRMKSPSRRKFVTVCINGTQVTPQLDTGSDLTLISKQTWDMIGRPLVEHTKCIVRNASGGSLKLTGKLNCSVTFKGIHLNGTCYLANYTGLDLLGLDQINEPQLLDHPSMPFLTKQLQMALIRAREHHVLSQYSNVIGCRKPPWLEGAGNKA
ncbi:hypothetical protein CLF_109535 [Clonorchis sinensis]|uniref:Peptidase A2 domain-containing protein n=1 Tax=Clonorchis sinensis TaxID=79923 RepID=G7YJH2_CLOSI|nr:hypothetical protein CLF_109535 [Clonorchis sinensis]